MEHNVSFEPVGQGLFSTGSLLPYCFGSGYRFGWVYDCGTSSSKALLKDPIQRLCHIASRQSGPRPLIKLLTLSHFDHDHISGVVQVLDLYDVETLLLPYAPLARRLAAVFALPSADPESISFAVDPVAFIARLGDRRVRRLVFVRPGSADASPERPRPLEPNGPPDWDDPWNVTGDYDNPHFEEGAEGNGDGADLAGLLRSGAETGLEVRVLKLGGALYAGSAWEFVPYNDSHLVPGPPQSFVEAVRARSAALLAAGSSNLRKQALADLKECYGNQFGESSKRRNAISLFLYSGPIAPAWIRAWKPTNVRLRRPRKWRRDRCSVLYTGDGYLDSHERLRLLARHMTPERMAVVHCLQVMHHGSRRNWHRGLARKLSPDLSIFSSDPAHKKFGHPHYPVWSDFRRFGRVSVDKTKRFDARSYVEFP